MLTQQSDLLTQLSTRELISWLLHGCLFASCEALVRLYFVYHGLKGLWPNEDVPKSAQEGMFAMATACATARFITLLHSKTLRMMQKCCCCYLSDDANENIEAYFQSLTAHPRHDNDEERQAHHEGVFNVDLFHGGVLGALVPLSMMNVSQDSLQENLGFYLGLYVFLGVWMSVMYTMAYLPGVSAFDRCDALIDTFVARQGNQTEILESAILYGFVLFGVGVGLQAALDALHEEVDLPGYSDDMLHGFVFGGVYVLLARLLAPWIRQYGPPACVHTCRGIAAIPNAIGGCFSWMGRQCGNRVVQPCVGFFNKCRDACRRDDGQAAVGQRQEVEQAQRPRVGAHAPIPVIIQNA